MDSELIKLKESVLLLTSELTQDNIKIKLLHIEYLLSDFDFVNDLEETENLTPAQILNNSLEAPYLENTSQRVYFEWFAVLALYWLKKIDEIPLYKEKSLECCLHARNSAQIYLDKAVRTEKTVARKKKVENLALNKWLNDKRWGARRGLKKRAFKEYTGAYVQLEQEGKKVTYRAIAYRVWPKIKEFNVHPVTGGNIIGLDTKPKFPDDVIEILMDWFSQGVAGEKLKSPRAK